MLLQAATASAPLELRDLVQYIANAAAIGAFVFAWRTNTRVTRIETVLSEPEQGVIPTLSGMRKGNHHINVDLTEHGVRLDNHDREIDRLDREKEPRRSLQPTDIGILDRRTKS